MDMTQALDSLRADLPGCSLVAFTDLSSNLVLCLSAAAKPAQEEVDRLSAIASVVLDGSVAEGAAPVLQSGEGDSRAGTAMLLTERDAKVFLRQGGDAPEALICICAPDIDLRKVVDCGRATLDGIVSQT